MSTRQKVRREVGALLLIAALSLGVLWRVTFGGRVMAPADLLLLMEPWKHYARQFPEFQRVSNPILDAIQQFYPWRQYAGHSLRSGTIPLWNPYELCGTPFVANNQSAVFYPETWLHALMPTWRALGWATALHFFMSGSLMYWFLRVLRLQQPAALLGAIAFMFNGFFVGWLCFPSFRSVPAWVPGMLAAFELASQSRRWPWLALTGFFVGMQFLAGNLHVSVFVIILYAGYVLLRSWAVFIGGEPLAGVSLALGGAGACLGGVVLAAGQLLPVLELALMSSRAEGLSYAQILKCATPWPLLLTGLMPDIFGNPVDYNHWGAEIGPVYRAYTETAWYVGVLPWLLSPAAFLARRREQSWFWLGMMALGIALAFGSPVYALFYHIVPMAGSLSGLGRAILISSTALSVLGAIGFDALLERVRERGHALASRYAAWTALCVGAIGWVAGGVVWAQTGALEEALSGIGRYTSLQLARFAAILAMGGVLIGLLGRGRKATWAGIVGLLVIDLWVFVHKFTPAVRPDYLALRTQTVDIVRAASEPVRILSLGRDPIHRMAPNTPMIFGLEDIQGSDSLQIGAYHRLLSGLLTDRFGFSQPDPCLPAVSLLGAAFINSSVPLEGLPNLELVSSREGWLYRNRDALPRAFVAAGSKVVTSYGEALAHVTSPEFDPKTAVVIRTDLVKTGPARPPTSCHVCYVTPQLVRVEGEFQPGDLLLLTDAYYPGWRAFQDGDECPIIRADYALRAVEVKRPCRRIQWVYLPASFQAGAFASLCGLGVASGVGGHLLSNRRRSPR